MQHDGWVGDNPKNYTRDGAVHWLFENTFADLIALNERDFQSRIPSAPVRLADPFSAVLAQLDRSHARVEQVYQLEQRKAFERSDSREARELVYTCMTDAATLLRDLIYTAWVTSGGSVPDFDPNDQTNNPKNPRYNPATGSAAPAAPVLR